jgi:hypothetical protein
MFVYHYYHYTLLDQLFIQSKQNSTKKNKNKNKNKPNDTFTNLTIKEFFKKKIKKMKIASV